MIKASLYTLWLLTAVLHAAPEKIIHTEREIISLSQEKWKWMAEKKVELLSELFDDKAVFVHMGGSMSKEQELKTIKSGGIHYKHAEIQETSVRFIGDTAILLSRIRLDAVVGGNEVTNPFTVTEVYVKVGDKWKLGSLSFTNLNAAETKTKTATASKESNQIFESGKIWDIHLTFTAEQWKAMEPVQGRRPERGRDRSFLQGPEGGRNGIAAAFGIEYHYVHADLEFGPHQIKEVGVRYKGNGTFLTSRDSLKRSLKIDTNQFVKGQKLAGMTQLNLHNSVRDPSGMNETVAYGLFRAAKVPAPRTAYAKVFVTVPDLYEKKYFGLYDLVEDVGARFAKQHFGTSEGAIFKPVTSSLFGDLGDDWKAYNQTYDPKGTLTDADKKRMIEICKFVSSSSAEDFAKGLENYFELDNLARYLALTAWMCDLDGIMGPGQNYYMHLHPKTRKISFIAWDQDQTFGQFPRGTQEQRENLSILRPWNGRNSFMEKLYAAEPFKVKYLATLAELNKSVLRAEGIHKQVDELAKLLNAPIKEESATRLADFVKAAAGETIAVTMGPGYREPVQTKPIKPYVTMRWKSVDDQLAGRSEGMTISGR